jgi:hypothetical protein
MDVQRVHRTGQIRPVVVKTMAIRDTVEQAMLERREGIMAKTTKMPALTEEAGMRSYIEVMDLLRTCAGDDRLQNPSFLMESGNGIAWALPLIPLRKRKDPHPSLLEAEMTAMELCSKDPSPAGLRKRGRSLDDTDKPGKRVRFSSPGDDMELCDRPRIRFVSPPAATRLPHHAPEPLEDSTDSGR